MDFRDVILTELARRKKSRYWLAEACAGQIAKRTTYNYLAGKTRIADDKLAMLAEILNLKLKK